jgi:hypothetical protein
VAIAGPETALGGDWSVLRQRLGKPGSRVELQFAEDAREVTLDGAVGDEQRLCDLAVGKSPAGELGDTAFARRQRVEPGQDDAARARAGGAELGLGAFRETTGARAVGGVECVAEELSRLGAPVAPPQHCAEVDERARAFQHYVGVLECLNRLAKQQLSLFTAGGEAGRPLRDAEGARDAECPGKLELLFRKAPSLLLLAEREPGERGL